MPFQIVSQGSSSESQNNIDYQGIFALPFRNWGWTPIAGAFLYLGQRTQMV